MGESNGNKVATGGRQQSRPNVTRRKPGSFVPITSMIDVTFLLLIYFLLTTTFRQAEGQIPGTLPGRPIHGPPVVKTIPVQLRAVGEDCQGVVYSLVGVNKPLRSPQELIESLLARKSRFDKDTDVIVVIQASRLVRWRYVVEACNQANRANFQTTIQFHDRI